MALVERTVDHPQQDQTKPGSNVGVVVGVVGGRRPPKAAGEITCCRTGGHLAQGRWPMARSGRSASKGLRTSQSLAECPHRRLNSPLWRAANGSAGPRPSCPPRSSGPKNLGRKGCCLKGDTSVFWPMWSWQAAGGDLPLPHTRGPMTGVLKPGGRSAAARPAAGTNSTGPWEQRPRWWRRMVRPLGGVNTALPILTGAGPTIEARLASSPGWAR